MSFDAQFETAEVGEPFDRRVTVRGVSEIYWRRAHAFVPGAAGPTDVLNLASQELRALRDGVSVVEVKGFRYELRFDLEVRPGFSLVTRRAALRGLVLAIFVSGCGGTDLEKDAAAKRRSSPALEVPRGPSSWAPGMAPDESPPPPPATPPPPAAAEIAPGPSHFHDDCMASCPVRGPCGYTCAGYCGCMLARLEDLYGADGLSAEHHASPQGAPFLRALEAARAACAYRLGTEDDSVR